MAVVNSYGRILKTTKGSLTVTYQIHREGIAPPLAYTPLSESWSDNLFYFSTLSFKRSGNYTISFLLEGANVTGIKPIVYPVTVVAKVKRCGAPDAIDRLLALSYLQQSQRQFTARRKGQDLFIDVSTNGNVTPVLSELDAVKRVLVMFYLALPIGSMLMATTDGSSGIVV